MAKSKQALEDSELVAIIKSEKSSERQKQNAFNKIYSKYNRQLLYIINSSLRDMETAEDLLSISFQKAHSKIGSYNDKKTFSTWLFNIVKNTVIDHTRRAKSEVFSLDALSEKTTEESGMQFQIDSNLPNPEQEMVSKEQVSIINAAINQIKSKQTREVIKLRFVDGLSFSEINKELGLEENSSTTRVSALRGKQILQDALR